GRGPGRLQQRHAARRRRQRRRHGSGGCRQHRGDPRQAQDRQLAQAQRCDRGHPDLAGQGVSHPPPGRVQAGPVLLRGPGPQQVQPRAGTPQGAGRRKRPGNVIPPRWRCLPAAGVGSATATAGRQAPWIRLWHSARTPEALESCMRMLVIGCALSLMAGTSLAADPPTTAPDAVDKALAAVIAGDWRSADNAARDCHRHPAETLAFFGLQPQQTVIEITPGGGWYAEILAPYLRDGGTYIAAIVDPMALPEGRGRDYQQRGKDNIEKAFAAAPAQFDRATFVAYDPAAPKFGADNSADLVVTFRNVHNWRGSGQAEGMFQGFFNVLKPGGVL